MKKLHVLIMALGFIATTAIPNEELTKKYSIEVLKKGEDGT